jgi:hypothetical protein
LTGVSVSGLTGGAPESTLFPDLRAQKRQRIEVVASRIAERFGDERAVTRATLLAAGRTRTRRRPRSN